MQGVENLRPFLFPAISSITIMNTEPEAKTNEYLIGIVANLPEKPDGHLLQARIPERLLLLL